MELAGNVLIEGAAEANIQALAAVADCQDRFAGSKGMLDDCEISFFPVRVGVVRLCVAQRTIKGRIHVGGCAR